VQDAYEIETIRAQISDIAWEVGFDNDRVIQVVVYRRRDVWDTPRRSSPFIKVIHSEGVVL
jgi:DNA-binding response OmpR family regulator